MWGKRKKRRAQLSRQLALGLLEDAMGRVQQQEWDDDEDDPPPYPGAAPAPESGSAPPGQVGLQAADVPVDNCAGPAADDDPPPLQQELPAQRTGENSHHGTFG
jgi:hypothetical protein